MKIEIQATVDEATAAAIMAAVSVVLATETSPDALQPAGSAWASAGRMANQGLAAARGSVTWGNADRMGRAARWSGGTLASMYEW